MANIGDAGAASGIAGLVRSIAVLQHALVPGAPEVPHLSSIKDNLVPIPKIDVFPSHNTNLITEPGRPLSAAINSFSASGGTGCDTGVAAIIQQYRCLPHMAGVPMWLVLGVDLREFYYPRFFEALLPSPLIKSALKFLEVRLDGIFNKYRFSIERGEAISKATILKAYFALLAPLSSLDAGVFTIWSTNRRNEITALFFAGSVGIDAVILLLSGEIPRETSNPFSFPTLIKMMKPPEIPVYSCVQGKILSEETFRDDRLLQQYIEDLIVTPQDTDDPRHFMEFLRVRKEQEHLHPESKTVLYITSDEAPSLIQEDADIVTISFNNVIDSNGSRYLRKKFLNLRGSADKIRYGRIRRPSSERHRVLPDFYENYPLRRRLEVERVHTGLCSVL
jgi:hypothetical protein